MRYINIKMAQPGMILGKAVYNENGGLILNNIRQEEQPDGTKKIVPVELTQFNIEKFMERNINYICIDDDLTKGVEIKEVIPDYLKNSTIESLKKLDVTQTIKNADEFVETILREQNISADIYLDLNDNNSLYQHSLAVTQFAILLGNALKDPNAIKDRGILKELAVASLLHDVGKMCDINPEYLNKYDFKAGFKLFNLECPETYDDKFHPLYGYIMLKDDKLLGSVVKNSILRHHENRDNTGVKYKTSSMQDGISQEDKTATKISKIINIADTFVRLMTNTYKDAKITSVTEAIEYLQAYSGTKFDKDYVDTFLEAVPILPKGLEVNLSNGMTAIIAEFNSKFPTRPKVITDGIKNIVDLTDSRLQSLLISIPNSEHDIIEKHL